MPPGLLTEFGLGRPSPPPFMTSPGDRPAATPNESLRLVEDFIEVIAELLSKPQQLTDDWQKLVVAATGGRMQELYAARNDYLDLLGYWEGLTRDAVEVVSRLRGSDVVLSQVVAELREVVTEIAWFRDRLAARWNSLEDLEDLVADDYPLTSAQLSALAKKHPPPPEWYEGDEEKPF